ncbi:Nn.00g078090.m01.CDS01 [Neocucurbitaria sp. VM-36]
MYSSSVPHTTAQTSPPSLLAQAPKLSPPSSKSRNASPVRKPLHERSNSQTNQYSGPTIRIVEDPGDKIYGKFPIPSEPSQILAPPRHAQGYGFERPGSRVSSGSQVANTIAKFEASRTREPQPVLHRKKPFSVRHSVSTSTSEADTLVASSFSPSSVRFSQGSTPPTSPPPEVNEFEKGLEILEEEAAFPSQRPTIRAVPPSSSGGESLESRACALTPKASAASPASPIPAASPPPISNAGNWSSISVSRPLPKGHKHTLSSDSEQGRLALAGDIDCHQPVLKPKPSTESFAYSDISYTSIEPTYTQPVSQPSPTLHEARTATFASGIRINYPIVRAPSASSLRAESQNPLNIASRMQDRSFVHQWSSQLSTIPSMSERDSRSIARGSRSFGARSQSQDSYAGNGRTHLPRRRGQTVGSAQSSSDNVSSEGHTEFSAVPRPLFSPVSRASTEEKDYHGEHLDTISPLPTSVPLRMKSSGYLRRHNSDAGSATDSRPGSAQSDVSTFIHNAIPAWARVYYQRGERISVGAPESESSGSIRLGTSHSGRTATPSEGNFPLSIYRPRNRPRNRASQLDTMSFTDDMQPIDGDVYVLGPNMHPLSGYSTPHLRTDRRGRRRCSAWKAPSLDDDLNRTLFGRQNRQILLFCVGFIFPLAWMIASFLPLPLDPNLADTPSQADLEQQFAREFGPTDDKSFQKATWWRNLNRIMSGIGTLLIGLIIALAILASRMAS